MSAVAAWLLAVAFAPGTAAPAQIHPAALTIPKVSEVRAGPAIDRALAQRQTGVFTMFRASLAQDGEIETRAIVVDGQLVEALAQRRGQPLRRIVSTLPHQTGNLALVRLGQFRLDQPITDPGTRQALLALLGWRGAVMVGPATAIPVAEAGPGPVRGLVFFDAAGRAALARWAFEYVPGQSFTFSNGPQRIAWSLRG